MNDPEASFVAATQAIEVAVVEEDGQNVIQYRDENGPVSNGDVNAARGAYITWVCVEHDMLIYVKWGDVDGVEGRISPFNGFGYFAQQGQEVGVRVRLRARRTKFQYGVIVLLDDGTYVSDDPRIFIN